MDNSLEVSSGQPAAAKEKQRAHDYRPSNVRAVSCDSNAAVLNGGHTYSDASNSKSRGPDKASDLSGLDNSQKWPSLTLNDNDDEPFVDEPLPPPEVTSTSVMALLRLKSAMLHVRDAIGMFEEFNRICHGKNLDKCSWIAGTNTAQDTPAWSYDLDQEVYSIRCAMGSMRHAAAKLAYLRDCGQGTGELTDLEKLAWDIAAIEKKATSGWKDRTAKFQGKGDDPRSREEHARAYQQYVDETYGGKIMDALGRMMNMVGEIEVLKKELKSTWKRMSRMSEKELEEIEGGY